MRERDTVMLEHFGDITMIQEVLQQAQTGLWIIEIEEGKEPRMYADKAMLGLLGLEEEPEPEVCYRAWYDRIIPEYYPQVEKGVEQMMRHRRAEVQYPWKHPKWGRIYVRCGGVRDDSYEDGVRLRGYHQNITDTIRAEQESDAVIRALSERYKGIYLCNMETEEIKTIKDYQEIGGYVGGCSSLQEFLCLYASSSVLPEYRKYFLELASGNRLMERLTGESGRVEYIYRVVSGNWRLLLLLPFSVSGGESPIIIMAFDDQNAEMEEHYNQMIAQAAVSRMYTLAVSVDMGKTEYHCVHCAEENLKIDRNGSFADYIGRLQERVCQEDREELQAIYCEESYRDRGCLQGELRMWDKKKQLHYYTYYAALIEQDTGGGFLLLMRNVDVKREEDEKNRQALLTAYESAKTANEAKTNFLARMSHDIRTPMNAIVGMTAIAQANAGDTEKIQDCLHKISISSEHLLELLNEVLDMSRIETGKISLAKESFHLQELIQSIGTIIGHEIEEKGHRLTICTDEVIHRDVQGDTGRIRQILLNLITNAVKYTPDGGCIGLAAKEKVSDIAGYGKFEFIVEDNGIGMDEKFLEHVYDPFERADDERVKNIQGTGLGMSIVKGLVSMMQGDVQVRSVPGKGTRFTVTLYLKLENREEISEKKKTDRPVTNLLDSNPLAGIRILLVEDNELNQEIARELLEMAGAVVELANNGREAVDMVQEHPDRYGTILMDIRMPVMDGCEAARRIRALGRPDTDRVPIIAMTANAFSEDVKQSLDSGMNAHIAKPIDMEKIIRTIQEYVWNS